MPQPPIVNLEGIRIVIQPDEVTPNATGIGVANESSLHAALKAQYALPGDRVEVEMDGFIVDIAREDLLIEIQTANFASVRQKLRRLLRSHRLQLVYPIAEEKWIVKIAPADSAIISRRKSPKRGTVYDLFQELVRMPDLVNYMGFSLVVLMTRQEEIRCPDGQGSWRRKGVSIKDRRLLEIIRQVKFADRNDFVRLLPADLDQPFSNRDLAAWLGLSVSLARRMTYCLRKMGAIEVAGQADHERLFAKAK